MKRMLAIFSIVLAGLGVSGALVARHATRTAAPKPATKPLARTSTQPLPVKLRTEEQRQRPWEARN